MTDYALRTTGEQTRNGLVIELTRVLDALSVTRPGDDLLQRSSRTVGRLADELENLPVVPDDPGIPAHSPDNPRLGPDERGLVPTLHIDGDTEDRLTGRIVFGPRFAGTGSVHGGAISLFFDDFLGRLANRSSTRPLARTAYLHIDFRSLTPIAAELRCEGWVERVEGRKRILRATIRHAEVVVAEAEGLWVEMRTHSKENR